MNDIEKRKNIHKKLTLMKINHTVLFLVLFYWIFMYCIEKCIEMCLKMLNYKNNLQIYTTNKLAVKWHENMQFYYLTKKCYFTFF